MEHVYQGGRKGPAGSCLGSLLSHERRFERKSTESAGCRHLFAQIARGAADPIQCHEHVLTFVKYWRGGHCKRGFGRMASGPPDGMMEIRSNSRRKGFDIFPASEWA
jgi:hypothetical protein